MRENFGLSSRKFSDAVTRIRMSRPLATLVGLETPLTYLTDEKAVFALTRWAETYPPQVYDPKDLGTDYFERDWEEMRERQRVTKAFIDAIIAELDDEEVADIEVLSISAAAASSVSITTRCWRMRLPNNGWRSPAGVASITS